MTGGAAASSPTASGSFAREPIAVVGVGCRLPGGIADPDGLWEALLQGRDCVGDIPGDRWDPAWFLDPTGRTPGRSYTQQGGVLAEDPKAFDAAFFGILPREAAILDPQQRLLLQCSWEAFEDAGEPPEQHAGSPTGVFVGGFMMDSQMIHGDPVNRERISTHSATANTLTMLSNRLSYVFDLRGPSVSLDAACASSLVAVHQACQSIWAGESDAALVGGVNVMLSPETQVTLAKGRFLSPTGRCRAFSADADGYVRAEGAVVLLLKPLSAAQRAGNTVHAVILGTATNHDGRTTGITVPRADAQIAVMRSAYAQAGIPPSQVCYIEAHGTGTPVGDPVEAAAIGAVAGAERTGEPCRVGSIKTNLGHLEAAAGAAGLLKAALCVKHGVVPPHLHLSAVNPAIDLDALNVTIPTAAEPLPRLHGRRVAGVNSFGYGGTNAHVVLAEPPAAPAVADDGNRPAPLLLISARSPAALRQLAEQHARALSRPSVDLRSHCRSAAVHRSHHRFRAAFDAADRSSLLASLAAYAQDPADAEPALEAPGLTFVYTGMGPQWWAMGRELLGAEPVFRAAAEECDAVFREVAGWSVLAELLAGESASRMVATEVAQPANVVLQIALTRLLSTWGVVPDAVVGHSVGEVAAAFASGALGLRDTLRVAYHRSRLQARLAGRGTMLAVGLPPHDTAAYLGRFEDRVSVAAVNSANSVTLAGEQDALEKLAGQLAQSGVFARFLRVEVPYHSAAMEEIHDELVASLGGLTPGAPALDVYSTVTGTRLGDLRHDAVYWWHNARDTVRFADALAAAITDGQRIFLEVGPHPVLAGSIRDGLSHVGVAGVTVASLTRGTPEGASLRTALRALYTAGARIDWAAFFGPGAYTPVPKYPWQQAVSWAENERSARRRVHHDHHPMVREVGDGPPPRLVADISFGALPYLEDHVVAGAVLFPAAGCVELALAARHALTGSPQCSIEDLDLAAAVPLDAETAARLVVTASPDSPVLSIYHQRDDAAPALCARASLFPVGRTRPAVNVDALRRRLTEDVGPDAVYAELARRGLCYGPRFQAVGALARSGGEVLARLALPDAVDGRGYHLHPVLLDAALHSLIAAADLPIRQQLIPVAIERIQFFGGTLPPAYSYGRAVSADRRDVRGDITVLGADGAVIAEITGFTCRLLPRGESPDQLRRYLFTRCWVPLDAETNAGISWLVLNRADPGPVLAELARRSDPVWLVDTRWAAPPADTDDPVRQGADAVEALLATIRSLPAGKPARYFVVTRGAEALAGDATPPAVDRAVLAGVARTVMSERPDLVLTLVDVDGVGNDVAELVAVLGTVGPEQEVAVRGGKLLCARIDHAATDLVEQPEPQTVPARPGSAFLLDPRPAEHPTGFVAGARSAPGADEVEIEVEVAALGPGLPVVGRVGRVGSAVTGVDVGDLVHTVPTGPLRSHVVAAWRAVVVLPDSARPESFAGLGAMLVAYCGLVKVAALQKGETVLVHDAAGGVGLAAVEIATGVGAEVIATAPSPEQRDYLRRLGIARVSDSQQVGFYDDVLEATDGRGVDVVLGGVGGERRAKSVACLAPFGRFVDLGNVERDASLGWRSPQKNLLIARVDFEELCTERPDYLAALYTEVLALLEQRTLAGPPVTVIPAGQVAEAFRLAGDARQVGQVCVSMRDPQLTLRRYPPQRIRPDVTYLVTGGLGGVGLQTAAWLLERGARHLVLVSRRGAASPEAQAWLCRLPRDVTVRAFAADVADRAQLAGVLDEVAATMPPLRGVIHSAAVFDDRPVAELDRGSLDRVLRPKALGAWHLHTLTGALDFFVLYSSISALIGNPGQANYVAANAALEALAARRHHLGLPASVIQWGALGETGLVARDATVARHLRQLGLTPLGIDAAFAALGVVIDRGVDSVAVVDADWPRLAALIPPTSGRRRFERLAGEHDGDGRGPALQVLDGLSDAEARQTVEDIVATIVAAELGLPASSPPERAQPLTDLGVDSLMGLDIAAALEKALGLRVSAMDVASGWSIAQIAEIVLDRRQ
ncbi:type I polyketide synthase [Mycobacterium sp.]|uniref:type I polyketide synthase n=1 Tax=Mycobacterium sp. TaxID=1785 RepID=UPI00127FAFDC|nr:type I polyketide synthase [Mycobacterium sp.]KAA8969659.1 MAG: SDR family NAD(P)-dependent oxidoreductase [Mycobacterium sp.]